MLWLLLALVALGQSCTRDSYATLPNPPAFPTATYTTTEPASSFVKDHWSQVVKLLRPPNTVNTTQSGCPHIVTPNLVDWHTASIWPGGVLPTNGSNVTIPAGKNVLVSSCSINPAFIFNYITVPNSSQLIFGDAAISIQANGMIVQGKFLVGSPTCRLRNKISITLHGSRPSTVPADPYVKGIAVTGQIDLHGVEYFPTWTRLAKTASPGDSTIFIQDCPNWQSGQTIVLTTTELKDARDFNRNEEAVISSVKKVSSVSATTCAVTLSTPLKYKHYGGLEYQAEVGLLSRNILFQGAADSEPTDNQKTTCSSTAYPRSTYACSDQFLTGWGAHIMVMGSGVTAGRFSGVEAFRVGQTNALARYPIHWHMVGNISVPKAHYATDCAVHHSFFRCFTIHGTAGTNLSTGVTLTKNVGYDVTGHCFFCSEDGMEENNTISYNLGAHIHILGPYWEASESVVETLPVSQQNVNGAQSFGSQYTNWINSNPKMILADDVGASPFYFTNAYNEIYGNAASGGWAGFSFPNLKSPVGASRNNTWFVPKNRPLLRFQGNSAHSTGYWQSHASGVYLGGNLHLKDGQIPTTSDTATVYTVGRDLPARDTCTDNRYGGLVVTSGCPADKQVWLRFEDTKVFLANVGLQSWGNREEIVRFEVHDCGLSTNVFGQVWIDQMLVNCRTQNVPTYLSGCNITGTNYYSCNVRDYTWWKSYNGFQFYDTGQSHLVTNSKFSNCKAGPKTCADYPGSGCTGTPSATTTKIWTYLTHSDQFTPGLMQQTQNISYENVDEANIMASSTSERYVSVSGKAANWFDGDGTIVPSLKFQGKRVNIGSNWTNDWWKFNTNCVETMGNWICPLSPGDSIASVNMHWDIASESTIGTSTCSNGPRKSPQTVDNNWGYYSCPIGAQITHFGKTEGSATYGVSLMPRVTGPLIASSGGWFVRYTAGTPTKITFTDMQIKHDDIMLLGIPYPTSTTFKVYAQAPTWCNPGVAPFKPWNPICTHTYTAVSSVSAVRAGWGDVYYFDKTKGILYIRIVELASFPGSFATQATLNQSLVWNKTTTTNKYFARGPLSLLVTGSNAYSVVVEASSCGAVNGKCANNTVAVPAALSAVPAPINARLEENDEPSNSKVGAIVGGVVGGVVGLVLISVLVAYVVLRSKHQESERV